jgi:hypothetical protein
MTTDPTMHLVESKQTGLIDQVSEPLVLDIGKSSRKVAHAEAKPLMKDADGDPLLM